MNLDDRTAQRKAQPHASLEVAALPAGLARRAIVEHVEDALALLIRNTRALVQNSDAHARRAPLDHASGGHGDVPVGRRVGNGVVHQIDDDLHDQTRVHVGHEQLVFQLDAQSALRNAPVHMLQSLLNHVAHQFRLHGQLHRAVVDARDGQKVLHQRDQPACVVVNVAIHMLLLLRAQCAPVVQQHVGISGNAGQRRAQIMGNGAQQIRPQRLLLHAHLHASALVRKEDLLGRLAAFIQNGKQQILLERTEILFAIDIVHGNARHAEHDVFGTDGQIQALRIGQGVGRGTGALVVQSRPCGHCGLRRRSKRR